MKDICVIVPTLNPNVDVLEKFLNNLQKEFQNILLFDDGCREEYSDFFKKCEKKGITVLHHYINLGKGRSLKDAYNYVLVNMPKIKGVVTCDSDGQHAVKDIVECANLVIKHPDHLILGCRDFNQDNVILKNKLGNKITCTVFSLFVGLKISDTQTGLRGLSRDIMCKTLDDKGERFEYETNQLVNSKDKNIPIFEYKIETIYEEKEKYETHFNPITDSIAIYKTFFKYIFSALSSFLVDVILFAIFNSYIKNIVASTVLARCISSLFNYILNSKAVFKASNKTSIIKYYILVVVQMLVSGFATSYIAGFVHASKNLIVIIKVIVDTIIFVVNYFVQRKFIFNK